MERRENITEVRSSGARQLAAASMFGAVAFALLFAFAALMLATTLAPAQAYAASSQDMYRLYNPNSGEHFYTASAEERDHLDNIGWNYEGVGWVAPTSSNTPVYRLYNPNAGDHHYTMSTTERDSLVEAGWNDEGIGWYSDDSKTVSVWRQYNPNAVAGAHNYTADGAESDNLVTLGWNYEGVGWYAISAPTASEATVFVTPSSTSSLDSIKSLQERRKAAADSYRRTKEAQSLYQRLRDQGYNVTYEQVFNSIK